MAIKMTGQGFQGNSKFYAPDLRFSVQINGPLHSTLKIGTAAGKNVEVNPHGVGSDFKLPVEEFARRIGLEEGLDDVAVPELVAAAIRVGIAEDVKIAVAAFKAQIQHFIRPQNSDRSLTGRIRVLPPPIR